jgi:hypothetical protein
MLGISLFDASYSHGSASRVSTLGGLFLTRRSPRERIPLGLASKQIALPDWVTNERRRYQ